MGIKKEIEIKQLANQLFNKFNLDDWKFKFDRAVIRRGLCSHRKKTISISKPLAIRMSINEVRDTLLHEIAHALVGAGNGHNYVWKVKALSIGCNGERIATDNVILKEKYIGECPNCHIQIKRYRRKRIACSLCCNKYNNGHFSEEYLFKWKEAK